MQMLCDMDDKYKQYDFVITIGSNFDEFQSNSADYIVRICIIKYI
jgi:hypothetical protein